jgi:hypothetical protein
LINEQPDSSRSIPVISPFRRAKTTAGKPKPELYATHKDGRKLYRPQWDDNGEIIDTGLPIVAVSIDQDGKTFPEGSTWIRASRSWGHLPGWTTAGEPERKTTGQKIGQSTQTVQAAPEKPCRTKRRTRRTCPCTRTFLAKRADAKYCSNACQLRASRQ